LDARAERAYLLLALHVLRCTDHLHPINLRHPAPCPLQHGGFKPLAAAVSASGSPAERNIKLLWGVGLVTFFLSAMLDNLTTTIVMLSVLQVRQSAVQQEVAQRCLATIAAAASSVPFNSSK
jgi:hypothetical protein